MFHVYRVNITYRDYRMYVFHVLGLRLLIPITPITIGFGSRLLGFDKRGARPVNHMNLTHMEYANHKSTLNPINDAHPINVGHMNPITPVSPEIIVHINTMTSSASTSAARDPSHLAPISASESSKPSRPSITCQYREAIIQHRDIIHKNI